MTYMNRCILFLILFFCSSCAQFTIQDYKSVYQATFSKSDNDIYISEDYIDSKEYSFAKVKIGDDAPAILVLAFIRNDLFVWVSSNGQKLVTKNGKIIETFGLKHNIKILDSKDFQLFKSKFNLLAQLDNPKAVIKYNLKISKDPKKGFAETSENNLLFYYEEFSSSNIRWKGKNYYWVDPDSNLTIRTDQSIHPFEERVKIDFYYK